MNSSPDLLCRYTIDRNDRITSVNEQWLTFARQNDGAHLEPKRVVRKTLWTFIEGIECRLIYKLILDKVRESRRRIVFLLRCDAPDRVRHLHMQIMSAMGGACEFRTTIVKERRRAPVPLLDAHRERSQECIPLCSWCMRVEARGGRWRGVERAQRGMPENGKLPRLLHTICPRCFQRMERVVEGVWG